MRGTTSKDVRTRAVLAVLLALTVQLIVACGPRPVAGRFYVVFEPTETERFLDALVSMTEDMGLSANVGHAERGSRGRLHIVEATSWSVRLWAQNVVKLSRDEDPSVCGSHEGTYLDPAQFMIDATPRWLALDPEAAATVTRDVFARLESLGYVVSEDQAICGLAVLANSLPAR